MEERKKERKKKKESVLNVGHFQGDLFKVPPNSLQKPI